MKKKKRDRRSLSRRDFLGQVGLFLAGTTLVGDNIACANFEIEIPCLGPASPPTPVPGMTYLWASKLGCALDCDLRTGRNKYSGGVATDDAPRINAALSEATKENPITLILDGSALISGLYLPPAGYWNIAGLGCGTGIFIKAGSNSDGIHNGGPNAANPSDPGPPAPDRGNNVSLRNFTINGNSGTGHNGDSTTGSPQGVTRSDPNLWYFCVDLMNLDQITIENLVIVNSPSYHVRLSNVGYVAVSGCIFRSRGHNTDGLHFDGPANDIEVFNCNFTTGDDAIALNCPEGYSGNISRVFVHDCVFDSWTLMRLYTIAGNGGTSKFNIDTVMVKNCSGRLGLAGFLLGQGTNANPNSVADLTVSNCDLNSPAVLELGANFGAVTLTDVTLTPLHSLQLPGFALARSSTANYECVYVGGSLTINDCIIDRDADYKVSAVVMDYGSSIEHLTFNGLRIKDHGGYARAPALIDLLSGSVGEIAINSVDATELAQPVSPGGFSNVSSISGVGVLETGWEFPDSVMADGVPYISANTGSPSIKVNGVVQPYP